MDVTPKSSDGETRSVSSSELQPTNPMETSTGVASSLLGKRKDPGESEGDRESVDDAEVKDDDDDDDDDNDNDNDNDDDEEEEEEEEDSEFEWDKDSFDGKEYNSSDYDGDYCGDKELEKMSRFYYRTIIETKGFFDGTEGFPPVRWGGLGTVEDLDDAIEDGMTARQLLINLATECVEKYNKTKKKNLRFNDVLRANFHGGSVIKYYITFNARESDSPDAPLVQYQAKAAEIRRKTYPILCRPSPVNVIEESGSRS